MDIRVKAALRMGAVFGAGLVSAGVVYLANTFMTEAVFIGVVLGAMGGFTLYNVYRIFLSIEEMKEKTKKL